MYKVVYVKCNRIHEKHISQMIVLYRLCAMFTLGSIVGVFISLIVK
jgi:hypothetical protein